MSVTVGEATIFLSIWAASIALSFVLWLIYGMLGRIREELREIAKK